VFDEGFHVSECHENRNASCRLARSLRLEM
jgi:hypothetical protein